jgi:site-specific recombinase XerD
MYHEWLTVIEKCLIEKQKSENTKKLYLHIYKNFFKHFGDYTDSLTENDIEEYFAKKRFNARNRNLAISALKFLFKNLSAKKLNLIRPSNRFRKDNVQILTKEEVLAIFNTEKNAQNKLLFMLVYSGFQIKDLIKFKKECLALFKIPNKILDFLSKKENIYLKNQEFILRFSPKKAEAVFQKALANAKIDKKIKLKNLKLSSIVHLLERGISYETIKLLHGLSNNLVIKQCEFLANNRNQNILNPIDWLYL